MTKSNYFSKSFINAVGVFAYVSLIALFFSNAEKIFPKENEIIIPIFMLLLFILSASTTGLLVLGKPIALFFNGLKKEALILLLATLGWLAIFLFIIIIISLSI